MRAAFRKSMIMFHTKKADLCPPFAYIWALFCVSLSELALVAREEIGARRQEL